MDIESLGYKTDFIFNRYDGSVEDKGEYIVVKSKSNPNYFWGNLLLYKRPPKLGDFEKWKLAFQSELNDPSIYHMTFAWDSPTAEAGDPSEFLAQGFELDRAVVLTASRVVEPPKFNSQVSVRRLETEDEFETAIQIQVRCGGPQLSRQSWEGFYRTQMTQYRKMIAGGLGHWFGAFLNGLQVGGLGVFSDKEVGRYQIVSTDVERRGQGVCSTLVYQSAKFAFENMKVKTLVMVADEAYHAAKIYETVGFKPTQRQIGLCWWDKAKHQ